MQDLAFRQSTVYPTCKSSLSAVPEGGKWMGIASFCLRLTRTSADWSALYDASMLTLPWEKQPCRILSRIGMYRVTGTFTLPKTVFLEFHVAVAWHYCDRIYVSPEIVPLYGTSFWLQFSGCTSLWKCLGLHHILVTYNFRRGISLAVHYITVRVKVVENQKCNNVRSQSKWYGQLRQHQRLSVRSVSIGNNDICKF